MIAGILFIIGGILIAVFPELLSLIVAFFLIIVGVHIVGISYYYKRARRHFENPYADFIFRF